MLLAIDDAAKKAMDAGWRFFAELQGKRASSVFGIYSHCG